MRDGIFVRGDAIGESRPFEGIAMHATKSVTKAVLILALALGFTSSASVQAQSSDGEDRRVMVYNDTSRAMFRFYASNTRRTGWEEDILGRGVIISGGSKRINIDDGTGMCMFDLKAVFEGGTEVVRRNFNVCRNSSWRISD